MSDWKSFLDEIRANIDELAGGKLHCVLFRGQPASKDNLHCSLGRLPADFDAANIENNLYYDFVSLGGPLLTDITSSWDILFLMRHHGLPTRLLDWTDTLGVAVYFALAGRKDTEDGSVWLLEQYRLNGQSTGKELVYNPKLDFMFDYRAAYLGSGELEDRKRAESFFKGGVASITPYRSNSRLLAQKGMFTLHHRIDKPLDELFPECVRRVVLPRSAFEEAAEFLVLAGVNEFSMFPDLDGLCRYLKAITRIR